MTDTRPDDALSPPPAGVCCIGGCRTRRHVVYTVIGWIIGVSAALSVAAIPLDVGESICGVWGCYPPANALLAMHLFWCVTTAAVVSLLALKPRLMRPVGYGLIALSLVGIASVIGFDLPRWLASASSFQQFWPQRVCYSIITLTDVPLLPALAAGLWCVASPNLKVQS